MTARKRLDPARAIVDSPGFRAVLAACEGDIAVTYSAATRAVIDWLSRGQGDEIKRHKIQAQALRQGLNVMSEYRDIIERNLSARVIHDPATGDNLTLTPWLDRENGVNPGPVLDAVASVVNQLVEDLETRNPQGMADRKDRSLFYCLGRAFGRAGLKRPPVAALRALGEAIDPDADGDKPEDSNILHAFDDGYKAAQK